MVVCYGSDSSSHSATESLPHEVLRPAFSLRAQLFCFPLPFVLTPSPCLGK